jgi:ABC-type transport system involved in cytochrome c biogenesis permease subunit
MMIAVLDTNFWLATHVTCVTFGYTATFVAGFFGIMYVIQGVFTRRLDADLRRSLSQMIYGIVCFATLLSFTGTVLGGIWADQSWGRFWGWDPKENGALLIVIWNALVLHARWCGLVKQRGMAVLAIAGNIVTAWSWFGTNQLGVGLHAYGFNEHLKDGLRWFWLSQLVLIGIGSMPLSRWRSFAPAVAQEPEEHTTVAGPRRHKVPATNAAS